MKALLFVVRYVLVAVGLVWIALAIAHAFERAQPTVLVDRTPVDFPLCVTVKPPALLDPVPGTHEYRLGRGRKNGGTA